MSQEFKKAILDWNNIQQKIKEANEQIAPFQRKIKGYKERANDIETKILDYMKQNRMDKSKLEIGDVVITMGESKRTESVNREYLLQKAKDYFKDDKQAEKFVNFVYETRQQTINNCLKRREIKAKK